VCLKFHFHVAKLVYIKYRNARCRDPTIKVIFNWCGNQIRVNMLRKQISRSKIKKFQEAKTDKYLIYDIRVANILHRPDLVKEAFGNGSGKDD
jgi:hypothetical protein